MKRAWSALVFTLLIAVAGLARQEKAFEPEDFSTFYYLRASGQPVELERQATEAIPRGVKILFSIPGEKSPVRLNVADPMQFIVRVTEDLPRATATIQLFRFEPQNGKRQMLVRRSEFRSNKASLKILTERYGESSVRVVPAEKLAPGEYCVSRTTIPQGYCFGVDATGSQ
jgi:hypothetical protein